MAGCMHVCHPVPRATRKTWQAMTLTPLLLALSGCATLPARAGGMAGDIRVNWLTKSPVVIGAICNAWGAGAVRTMVSFYENGQVKDATCEPVMP